MLGLLMRVAALAALAGPPGRPALEHTRYTLANGLEVILRPVHSVPLIAVHVRYHVGAADDPPGRRGLAHIVEHLSFEGTAHITGERAKLYRFYTGTVADNASTTLTSTDYYMTVPADYLATSLWIESDRMGFLGGMTTRSGLTAAQRVVANERRQRIDAEPYAELTERVYAALYPANHPYHGMLIGSMADIDAATVKDAEAFVAAWYTPANATLVLVGDLPRNTRALVDRYFGGLPAPAPASHAAVGQTPLAREVRLQASEAVGRSARVIAAWRSPARYTADDAVAEVLCDALTTGAGERLAMEQGGHAVFQVGFQQQAEPTVSTLIAQMSGRIGEPAVQVLAVMDHVLTLRRRGGADDRRDRQRSRARHHQQSHPPAEPGRASRTPPALRP